MATDFKYAVVKFNGKPVLLDKKAIADVTDSVKSRLTQLAESGFVLKTPDGMQPVRLGNFTDFSNWIAVQLLKDSSFDLKARLTELPPPFNSIANYVAQISIVLYSASMFYTGEGKTLADKTKTTTEPKKIYAELVLGFDFPPLADFPLELTQVVFSVGNYPAVPAVVAKQG